MDDVLVALERQLIGAIRERHAARRARRRRRLTLVAVAAAVLLAVSGASAISGRGPIADVLGVERDDPTLRSVRETPGAPRGMVRVRADDGHRYTFAAFHARERERDRGEATICFTQTRDDARRIPSLGCSKPGALAATLRRDGIMGGPTWGSAQAGGLRVTRTWTGLVPAGARGVSVRRDGSAPVAAQLSEPFPTRLGRPARMRAFLAVTSHDADGAEWLGGPVREVTTVILRDGTSKHVRFDDQPFFPMTGRSSPGDPRMDMELGRWHSVGYAGERGTLCTAAAVSGENPLRPGMLQCSSPLAVVNALARYGAAVYLSNPDPLRERGRRRMAVFGYARTDAEAVALVNQRGQRFEAELSEPWVVAARRPGDLAGLDGALRGRLERLPRTMRLRSYIASIPLPPEPASGRGLELRVTLAGGRRLVTRAE